MTTPCERTRALLEIRNLLERLQDPGRTARVPRWLRNEAWRLLRHYPSNSSLELAHLALPDWFGSVPGYGNPGGSADVHGSSG